MVSITQQAVGGTPRVHPRPKRRPCHLFTLCPGKYAKRAAEAHFLARRFGLLSDLDVLNSLGLV